MASIDDLLKIIERLKTSAIPSSGSGTDFVSSPPAIPAPLKMRLESLLKTASGSSLRSPSPLQQIQLALSDSKSTLTRFQRLSSVVGDALKELDKLSLPEVEEE